MNGEIRRTKAELLTRKVGAFAGKRGNWSKRSGSALITDFTGVPRPSRESCRQVLEKRNRGRKNIVQPVQPVKSNSPNL